MNGPTSPPTSSPSDRAAWAGMSREELRGHQLRKLNALLAEVLPRNRFWRERLREFSGTVRDWREWESVPYTSKADLIRADLEDREILRTFPPQDYVRVHRTSGTHAAPLRVFDTEADWRWWIEVWQYTLDAADVTSHDRAALAFSFGPFIGFWSAQAALEARGALLIPCGGMSSQARIEYFRQTRPTIVFCTPSYALRLSEAATEIGCDPRSLGVTRFVVAGEPGGSIPAIRARIEQVWNARVIDHAGASEVGAWGFATADGLGLHVVESEFIAEFLPHSRPLTAEAHGQTLPLDADGGPTLELVLTALGRIGWPAIRYRTGDLVRPRYDPAGACRFVILDRGILGRADEMLVIRGVNVFPTTLESILRQEADLGEFRIHLVRERSLDQIVIRAELDQAGCARVAGELEKRLGLRVRIEDVPRGSLPRFEAKAQRVVDERPTNPA